MSHTLEALATELAGLAVTRTGSPDRIKTAAGLSDYLNLDKLKEFASSDTGRYALGGLSGAGLGAIIGSMQPRRKGRNALYYGAMGGLGGLGLAHLYNQYGRSASPAAPPTPAAPSPAAEPPATGAKPAAPPPAATGAKPAAPPPAAAATQTPAASVPFTPPPRADIPLAPSDKTRYSAPRDITVTNPDGTKSFKRETGYPEAPPYALTRLWNYGPERADWQTKIRGVREPTLTAGSDYRDWLETGNIPWHKNLTGRQSVYMDRLREAQKKYFEKTQKPAETLDDLRTAGLIPGRGLQQYVDASPGINLDQAFIDRVNLVRSTPGAEEFFQRSGGDWDATLRYIKGETRRQTQGAQRLLKTPGPGMTGNPWPFWR